MKSKRNDLENFLDYISNESKAIIYEANSFNMDSDYISNESTVSYIIS